VGWGNWARAGCFVIIGMPIEYDLHQPANAHWIPAYQMTRSRPTWGGEARTFASTRDAVLFVMTELPERDRGSADRDGR
jgi:hypothetical protein